MQKNAEDKRKNGLVKGWKACHSVEDKTRLTIINEKIDIQTFNEVNTYWDMDSENREKNFVDNVHKICKLIAPSTEYIELLKNEEVRISTKAAIGEWTSMEHKNGFGATRIFNSFAVEGISSSPEFTLQMILRQFVLLMQKRMLTKLSEKKFQGKGFEWCEKELNYRLGMKNVKIYENLDKYLKKLKIKINMDKNGNSGNDVANGEENSSGPQQYEVSKVKKFIIPKLFEGHGVKLSYKLRQKHAKKDTVSIFFEKIS